MEFNKKSFIDLASLIPAAVFIVQDNKFVYYNEYFKFLTGLSDEDIKDKMFWDLVHDDYKELIKKRGQQRASGEDIINRYEFKINYKNTYKWVDYTAKFINYNNKNGFISVAVDITDKKEFEAKLKREKENAEKSDELKTAFLANISHEIRTPMNSILGFSNLLLKNISVEKKEEYAKNIHTSTSQLLEIINNIIEISKIQSDNVEINIDEINLNELFNELYSKYDIELKRRNKKSVKFILKIPKEENIIYTDAIKLNQVLSTLLTNAIKFTKKGKIEFGYDFANNNFNFYVKDTGIGIDKKILPNIFDRFFQVDLSNTKNYSGTGLGLAICKYYIKILGGEISVNSTINKGSVFKFNIPLEKDSVANNVNDDCLVLCKKNVLLIENDELQKILFVENLNDTKANIIVTKSYNAVEVFNKTNNIDIIILDGDNPEFDGIDILSKIKILSPKMPVIFVSSLKYYSDISIKAGADKFFLKPINFNKLEKTLISLV